MTATTITTKTVTDIPLTEDPFKAHILEYNSDDDYYYSDDDDDHVMEDDEDWADLEEEYERKEDEDVAVFRAIIDHMPIASLLHLLQGHVKAMQKQDELMETSVEVFHDAQQQLQDETQDTPMVSNEDSKEGEEDSKEGEEEEKEEKDEAMPVVKQFRWAVEDDYTVKSEIHEVEVIKQHRHLWFSGHELSAIRQDLVRQIRFFVMHHQERIATLDKVINGDGPEAVIEECIKELTRHSIGRGLEGHISRLIQQTRRQHVWGILNAQRTCNSNKSPYDETIEALRKQSLVNGEMMKLYAQRMAKSDEIEALTASMSRWEPTEASS
ncbi:MAG: hypothetical protein SGBAC_003775 [Bacillariaceae sp.]